VRIFSVLMMIVTARTKTGLHMSQLRLRSGERLLDRLRLGGLIIHAARFATKRSHNLSRPQAELANKRIRRAGLATAAVRKCGITGNGRNRRV
jgi:cyclopropane fatty-acyl-phospholipid synthase-like methyltransferase